MDAKRSAEALVPRFQFERLLNQDQAGRRSALYGAIDGQPALLILERAPFPTSTAYLGRAANTLRALTNLGANDIYHWYLASSGVIEIPVEESEGTDDEFADLKINLIYPCTEKHVKKYSKQGVRFVTETPEIYRDYVRPYMQAQREAGRLNWVYNIIEGRKEVEDVIYRTPYGQDPEEGFLLLPDLNWDRKTVEALHLLGIVERRDLWSLRDLKKKHLPWLRHMREKLIEATTKVYPTVEADQLKLYLHYQPTYYHLHIHIVHVQLEAGATQATGKAVGLESVMEQLEHMHVGPEDGDGSDVGMDRVTMCYTLGEASDLWVDVFEPLKRKKQARPTSEPGAASQSQ
ncbi:putative mRNA decapping protein [Thermochaetoides thermophila DSM 1495]|uniref:Putative mRNA decapping protein n=1 Tax=Chaetomium thermophilum (strain DSM 1495 / CBS 144.50 / IMI 039719) TaxID=759272 RepID=G0S8A3_CHATD|nr:putative mRNA decapping protein [Thermochaetoides thermophila DSM 1495]EGS21937.1 putative mRNA decapping protein [Thermochaetoides thermophila DSM 1495]